MMDVILETVFGYMDEMVRFVLSWVALITDDEHTMQPLLTALITATSIAIPSSIVLGICSGYAWRFLKDHWRHRHQGPQGMIGYYNPVHAGDPARRPSAHAPPSRASPVGWLGALRCCGCGRRADRGELRQWVFRIRATGDTAWRRLALPRPFVSFDDFREATATKLLGPEGSGAKAVRAMLLPDVLLADDEDVRTLEGKGEEIEIEFKE